jgi:hypothetical protein
MAVRQEPGTFTCNDPPHDKVMCPECTCLFGIEANRIELKSEEGQSVLRQNQQDRAGGRGHVNNGRFRSVRTTSPQLAPILASNAQNARLALLHRIRPGSPQIIRIKTHPTVPPEHPQKNSRTPLGRWPRSCGWTSHSPPLTLIMRCVAPSLCHSTALFSYTNTPTL